MAAAAAPPASLLERDDDLARVARLLADARAGSGALLVIEGPAGMGKTALLAAAAGRAEQDGMRVLRARGAAMEREFAFGVVRQLFEPPLARAGERERAEVLQGPARRAADLLGLPGTAPAAGAPAADPSFAILHGLYWLCANLAAQRPLVLSVDDAHWADASSLRFLAFLRQRLEELPAALIVALRPEEPGAAPDLLAALAADTAAALIRPAPLSRAAVGRLVGEQLQRPADPAFEAACHDATGGAPFLVSQLARALRDHGVAPERAAAARVPELGGRDVGRWLDRRLAALGPDAAALARAVAILESGPIHHAAALAGLDPAAAVAAADALAAAAILAPGRPLAFVHPMVRAGVYAAAPGGERAAAHRHAARLLERDGSALELVAEHLLATEPAGDEAVVATLARAAGAASGRGAPESAAVFLRRGLAEGPPAERRAQLLLDLALAEFNAGEPEARRHLEAARAAHPPGPARVGAAIVEAHVLARLEESADALAVIDDAARSLGPEDRELAHALDELAVGVGMLDAGTAAAVEARMRAVRARADRERAPSRELLGAAAIIAAYTNEPAAVTAELARRCLAAGPHAIPEPEDLPWFSEATISLTWAERVGEVAPVLDAAAAHARATGDAALFAATLSYRAWGVLRRGDLVAAEADARAVFSAGELPAPPLWHTLAGGLLIDALVEQGRLEEAEDVLAATGAAALRPTQTGAVLRHARGRLRLAQRRPQEALADLLAARAVHDRTFTVCRNCLPSRSDVALAHLALGDVDAARLAAAEDLRLARALGAPGALGVALCAAGLAAAGGAGEALLREAVATLDRAGAAVERARAQTELGALLRRANRRIEARSALVEALDTAHRAAAQPLLQRAETELRATGAKPRRVVLTGLESLTASERRVAELASEGLTNREIAQTLFVTARTVEGHLTNVFRKLGLASRDELGAALAAPLAS